MARTYDIVKQDRNKLVEKIRQNLQKGYLLTDGQLFNTDLLLPHNPSSESVYKGINRLKLFSAAFANKSKDPRWMTFNQISKNGYKIKKGSKGIRCEKWIVYKEIVAQDKNGRPIIKHEPLDKPMVKLFTVFNGQDIEGLPEYEHIQLTRGELSELIDDLISSSKCKIQETASDFAGYIPSQDIINMPNRGVFSDEISFVSVLIHEMAHSTGSKSRMNREFGAHGTQTYYREELRAELSSALVKSDFGIPIDESSIRKHSNYLKGYLDLLKDNDNEFIRALLDAQKISDLLVDQYKNIIKQKNLHNSKENFKALEIDQDLKHWANQNLQKELTAIMEIFVTEVAVEKDLNTEKEQLRFAIVDTKNSNNILTCSSKYISPKEAKLIIKKDNKVIGESELNFNIPGGYVHCLENVKANLDKFSNPKLLFSNFENIQYSESKKKISGNNKYTNNKKEEKETYENLKRNVKIADYARQLGYHVVKAGNKYLSLKEHDSVRIDPIKNTYWRNSTGTHGSIIDFSMEFENKSQRDATVDLLNRYADESFLTVQEQGYKSVDTYTPEEVEAGELQLPEKVAEFGKHAYAYLIKTRGIDKAIVTKMMKDENIYESKEHNHYNCVFVSRDENKKPQFACLRGTNPTQRFMKDIPGSDYEKGFQINNDSKTLIITESVIDALSVQSVLKGQDKNPNRYDYLALSGVSKTSPIVNYLNSHEKIENVLLALDNDKAGKDAIRKIYKDLSQNKQDVEVASFIPKNCKDWNEALTTAIKDKISMSQIESKQIYMDESNEVKQEYNTAKEPLPTAPSREPPPPDNDDLEL